MNQEVINNKNITICLSILLFLILHPYIYGQIKQIRFNHLSIEDGLSQSTVNCIIQDKKGFMWFGTMAGLNRYDGYEFVVYNDPREENGISDIDIWTICEDKKGFLWIGTNSGGVNRYDRETGKFYHYNISNGNLGHNDTRAIIEDSQGILWVGTNGGGLYKYDRENDRFNPFPLGGTGSGAERNQKVLSICEDCSGILWIGTEDGLYQSDLEKKSITHYTSWKDNSTDLNHISITSICWDRDGFLWIGTRGSGLLKFNPSDNFFTQYLHDLHDPKDSNGSLSSNNVSIVFLDSNGVPWVGTIDGGLNRFDRSTGTFSIYKHNSDNPLGISKNYINCIYEDSVGTLWIGTKAGGLNILPKNSIPFSLHRFPGLNYNDIRALYEDSLGILWLGTLECGIIGFNRKTGDYNNYKLDEKGLNNLQNSSVWAIHEDKFRRLWIGTKSGLYNLDRKKKKFIKHPYCEKKLNKSGYEDIYAIYEDANGNLWLGTKDGLHKINPNTGEFTLYRYDPLRTNSLCHDIVVSIFEDRPGIIWIGTRGGGLNKFDINGNRFIRYQHIEEDLNSLSHDIVWCICKDLSGGLWIGTSSGLNRFDEKTGKFKAYFKANGLPDNMICSIIPDKKDNLWMGTNKGLVKFDLKTETFKSYDGYDGLQSDEFNFGAFFINKKGELFFGGINGFNIFNPEEIKEDPSVPSIVLTNFLLANQPVAPQWKTPGSPLKRTINETDSLRLNYKQDVMTFEFAALHYANPQKNEYKYMLEGFDKVWIKTDAKNRRITYTNLPAGDYVFKVIGTNKDGIWNKTGTSIKVKILPPPWETLWAYTLYILASALILFLIWSAWKKRFFQQKADELERANEELEKKNQELKETQEQLIQSEKMSSLGMLLANLAHEINNPAATILLNSEFFVKEWPNISAIMDEYHKINQNIVLAGIPYEKAKEEINKLITGLNDSANHIQDLVKELKNFSQKTNAGEKNPVDINKAIQSAIHLTQNKIKKSTQNFQFKEEEGLPNIIGCTSRLIQVFINLVQNACEALPDDSKGICIETTLDKKNNEIIVQVKDEGVGIEKKDMKYIKDPFFTTKRNNGGTGLGLAISNKIIQEHDGKMSFESTPGKGTTVFVYIPIFTERK